MVSRLLPILHLRGLHVSDSPRSESGLARAAGSVAARLTAVGIAVPFGRVESNATNMAIALACGTGKGRVGQEKGVSARRNL
jgi:hypothetical protein